MKSVGRPTFGRYSTPRSAESNGSLQDRVSFFHTHHARMVGHRTESEDFQKFEEAERETQGKLQRPFLDGKEVKQVTEDRNHR